MEIQFSKAFATSRCRLPTQEGCASHGCPPRVQRSASCRSPHSQLFSEPSPFVFVTPSIFAVQASCRLNRSRRDVAIHICEGIEDFATAADVCDAGSLRAGREAD